MVAYQWWSVLTTLALLVFAWRTRKFTHHLAALDEIPTDGVANPKLTLVIPARNEQDTIESALRTLIQVDYPELEIVLVDDRSTDSTGQIMDQMASKDSRLKVVHVDDLPAGWLGKVHALECGLQAVTSEWILFSDADVHLSAESLKKAMAYVRRERLDFMTVIPEVRTTGTLLRVIIAQLFHQASLFFEPDRINDPSHRACYGQGAFLLFRKSVYQRSDRLEWLKMEVVDDTGFALLMRRAGARMGAVAGLHQVAIEWYPSFRHFWRGIEKNAFAFCQYSIVLQLGFVFSTWALFLGFTWAPWVAGWKFMVVAAVALAIYVVQIQKQLRRLMPVSAWTALVFPATFVLLPLIFARASFKAMWRGGVTWRGTFYELPDLKREQRMKLANLVFAPPDLVMQDSPPLASQ